jgi:hypothetical protein
MSRVKMPISNPVDMRTRGGPGLHATPELVTLLQQERERHIDRDHLARVAACHRACCSTPTSLADRVVRRLRPEVTPC